tara:strand:- start:1186 stop:1602 length:417 start_codon:yes stop_codon:yes gene_type:complete
LIKKLTDKDKKDWLTFIKKKEKLLDKEIKENNKNYNLEKTIDLHGYSLNLANNTIENFIHKCFKENISKITVITGKGNRSQNKNDPYKSEKLSILKYSIPEFIKSNSELLKIIKKINYSSIDNSSSGSFDIYLKKIKE